MSDQGLHKAEVDNKEIHAIWEHEEPDDGVPIVLVTGASGFVATHLVKELLEQGRYRVRGTVRDKRRYEKVNDLLIRNSGLYIYIHTETMKALECRTLAAQS